ncbi:MAG: response regulator, partial [Cyanobacteria bacterium J06632_3]
MRILLVDDDEHLMISLAERLIQQRYAVDIATDGSSAQTYVELFDYDLILLDLMLPDGDGIQFCQAFRQIGYGNPLMILTARESTSQKVKALDAGADDYVVKPFDFDELCARIRALLRREHKSLPTVLIWGALSLDPSTCETTYNGQPVRLTPKEFALMELFMRHPNRVYSLGAIIDDLWSFEDPPGEDAVRTHIKGLRRKLKAVGAPKDLIKTVYGLGYRLNENTHQSHTEKDDLAASAPLAETRANVALSAEIALSALSQSQAQSQSQRGDNGKTDSHSDTYVSGEADHAAFAEAALAADRMPTLTSQLAQACRQYLRNASQKITTLEKLVVALGKGELDSQLYEEGLMSAHQLSGSLGSYGIAEGSALARQLELSLRGLSVPFLVDQVDAIAPWVQQLRERID